MKIFAFNFALHLLLSDPEGHFRFRTTPMQHIHDRLHNHGLDFNGLVFYSENDGEALKIAKKLLFDPEIAQIRTEIGIYFKDEKERSKFAKAILKDCKPAPAAGGLVLNDHQELQMILRNGFWDLAKGKIEKGEDIETAAWREVSEETGLEQHKIQSKMGETYHVYFHKNKWRFKTTYWYWMKVSGRPKLSPQENEGITQVRWWPIQKLREEIPTTYPQIMGLIREVLQHQTPES